MVQNGARTQQPMTSILRYAVLLAAQFSVTISHAFVMHVPIVTPWL